MNKEKILIYDDEQGRTKDFKRKLGEGLEKAGQSEKFDIIALEKDAFQASINVLEQRRIAFRGNEESTKDSAEEIDNASIFIIDYDLLGRQVEESRVGSLTGEIVAYLVRCFSKCKLIVVLNQYGSNPFDLTLRGDLDSFADLNLGEDQLDNPYLWKGELGTFRRKFRPWCWPNLSDTLRDFDKRVEDVEKNLDTSICEFLDFGSELFQLLPREIVQFIEKQEDASRFYHRENCKEFLADTASPFTRRFVTYFDEVDYRPRVRFSL